MSEKFSVERFNRALSRYRRRISNKVFFLSFPKSGRTWVRVFLNKYYFELYPFSLLNLRDSKFVNEVPRFVFTHAGALEKDTEKIVKKYAKQIKHKKKIFLIRDPRDIFVSYYYQLTKRKHIEHFKSINDLIDLNISTILRHDQLGAKKIIAFLNCWINELQGDINCLIIHYEHIKAEPEKVFYDLLMFLNDEEEVNEHAFHSALEYSNFSSMRKREENGVHKLFELSPVNKGDNDSFKTRKGEIGGFRTVLSIEDILYFDHEMLSLNKLLRNIYA